MKVYVMRHGDAEYRAASDAERPLSATGADEATLMGTWLAETDQALAHSWVSPYLRARQTHALVIEALLHRVDHDTGCDTVTEQVSELVPELVPVGNPLTVTDRIAAFAAEHPGQNLLLVSHMPLVAEITAELVPGCEPPLFVTGAIAEIDWQPEAWQGKLIDLHCPACIRKQQRRSQSRPETTGLV